MKKILTFIFTTLGTLICFYYISHTGMKTNFIGIDSLWIVSICYLLSLLTTFLYMESENFTYFFCVLAGFMYLSVTSGALNVYEKHRWSEFYTDVKTEKVKYLTIKDSLIIDIYRDYAQETSDSLGSNYKIQFTRLLPDNIYGLTSVRDSVIYFNTNQFISPVKDSVARMYLITANVDCILHEISHALFTNKYGRKYADHGKEWCNFAKKYGVDVDRYQGDKGLTRKIKLYGQD